MAAPLQCPVGRGRQTPTGILREGLKTLAYIGLIHSVLAKGWGVGSGEAEGSEVAGHQKPLVGHVGFAVHVGEDDGRPGQDALPNL